MTREQRRALLGDDVIAAIHARVAQAPEPPDEVVEELRRILARPARPVPMPAAQPAPAAKAA
jgi:hypothetical protein